MATEFKLPELGESVETGTLVKILVQPGQQVEKDQDVLELETDKAVLQVPSSVSGTVGTILVKEGTTVTVGQPIFTVETGEQNGAAPAPAATEPSTAPGNGSTSGATGDSSAAAANEVRNIGASQGEDDELDAAVVSAPPDSNSKPISPDSGTDTSASSPNGAAKTMSAAGQTAPVRSDPAPASPTVRRVARELGIDIHDVQGSGPGGRISEDDVKNYARTAVTGAAGSTAPAGAAPAQAAIRLPDFSKWGAVERQPLSNVRRATAEHMHRSWSTIPHVTQFDQADITDLEELRKKFGKRAEAAGGKLTVTAIALKIVAAALKKFPQFNASLDMGAQEIVYKQYYHVGVAVDTDRGLLVPVIRDVDKKSIFELAAELTIVGEKARNRKTGLEDMQGGTFTITNLGGIGGTGFTPIVNAPEVAILGIARSKTEPVWIDNQWQPRLMLPLSLSYDHRVIDGADGARFLRWIAEALEQPFLLLLES